MPEENNSTPPSCKHCDIEMTKGSALVNEFVAGAGKTVDTPGATISRRGEALKIEVWKCPECGHSFTDDETLSEAQKIIASLQPLFEKAEKEGLWFYCNNLAVTFWFSPAELKERQKEGRYIWGPDNWKLRDPWKRVHEINNKIGDLMLEREKLFVRIEDSKKTDQ